MYKSNKQPHAHADESAPLTIEEKEYKAIKKFLNQRKIIQTFKDEDYIDLIEKENMSGGFNIDPQTIKTYYNSAKEDLNSQDQELVNKFTVIFYDYLYDKNLNGQAEPSEIDKAICYTAYRICMRMLINNQLRV